MSDNDYEKPPSAPEGEQVDPDELMGEISSLSFLKTAGISVVIHIILIAVTSIGFLMLCSKHKTWHPGAEVRRIAKEQRAEKLRNEREAAQKKLIADQRRPAGASAGTKPGAASRPASGVEKNITRKSTTLPAKSGVGLDDIDDI